MKIIASGATVTTAKPRRTAPPPVRTKNKGWTKHAALRNRRFLYSVVPEQLSGFGYSITHTIEDCESPELWQKWVSAYIKHLRKYWPLTRYHLVTEWQRRGMPHLHMACWFRGGVTSGSALKAGSDVIPSASREVVIGKDFPSERQLIQLWLKIAGQGNPASYAQDVKPINSDDAGHWLQYLAKHAVRGVSNYQRHASNVPIKWAGATGRVWRRGGDWPTENGMEVHGLTKAQEYQYRRLFTKYLASVPPTMRIKFDQKRSVRKFWLKWRRCTDRTQSHLRAPSSFISIENQVRLIKSINPDAFFTDEETGEIYHSVEEMPINRCSNWTAPPIYRAPVDMSDIGL